MSAAVTIIRRRINAVLERMRVDRQARAYPGYSMPHGFDLLGRQEDSILRGSWAMSNGMRLRLAALEKERLGRLSEAERGILRKQVEEEMA
jgi:hypothetical protein